MTTFDFQNATLPTLEPLLASHEVGGLEAQYKALFLDIWANHGAAQAFDLNVSGMAHLGSYEQVLRAINSDGLAMLPGGGNEYRTRYLYRAWNARNHRGRGLHFLDVYLQMLFPGIAKAEQLWMPVGGTYPDDCISIRPSEQFFMPSISDDSPLSVDGSWALDQMISIGDQSGKEYWDFNTSGLMLTSRVRITLDFSMDSAGAGNLAQIVRSVLPARFVPEFYYVIEVEAPTPIEVSSEIHVEIIPASAVSAFSGMTVTDRPGLMWRLGTDANRGAAPLLLTGLGSVEIS